MAKRAIVLFNLGGPDSLGAVQPFLENLFNDPDIFNLPFQKKIASFISRKRAPKVCKEYELIGGKSPIGYWTEIQRKQLADSLNQQGVETKVFTAMRYWHPLTQEVTKEIAKVEPDEINLLPLYPHFSISTTGSSFNEWKRYYRGDESKLRYINSYYDNEIYLRAVNERIEEGLNKFSSELRERVVLVFSAHGTPQSYVKKGDPYLKHIEATVRGIMEIRGDANKHRLCFQSKVGPMKWLEPSTEFMIKRLAEEKERYLLIIPISFVSDHVETLFELDIEYREIAEKAGIEKYIVMTGLNDSKIFTDALAQLVKSSV